MKNQQLLNNLPIGNKLILFDIDYTLFDRDLFGASNLTIYKVFDEVPRVLNELAPVGTLGILSQGETSFQMKKLQQTGILYHFAKENIHITPDKITLLKTVFDEYKTYDAIYFVDDKLDVLHVAQKYLPVLKTIWIKRGRYAKAQKPIKGFVPDLTVENLQKIVPVITKQ